MEVLLVLVTLIMLGFMVLPVVAIVRTVLQPPRRPRDRRPAA
jgi:hypothetical protein